MELKDGKAYGWEMIWMSLLMVLFSAIWFVGAVDVGRKVLDLLGHVLAAR